jgi:hypothetical protein
MTNSTPEPTIPELLVRQRNSLTCRNRRLHMAGTPTPRNRQHIGLRGNNFRGCRALGEALPGLGGSDTGLRGKFAPDRTARIGLVESIGRRLPPLYDPPEAPSRLSRVAEDRKSGYQASGEIARFTCKSPIFSDLTCRPGASRYAGAVRMGRKRGPKYPRATARSRQANQTVCN